MLSYSNGIYRYGLTSNNIEMDTTFESKPCNNQVLLNSTGASLCTSFDEKSIYEVDAKLSNVNASGSIYWNCSIGYKIYSLYTDGNTVNNK